MLTKTCSKPNCNTKHYAKTYCKKHYELFWRKGNTEVTGNLKKKCSLCDTLGTVGSGYCKKHYYQLVKKEYQREYMNEWNKRRAKEDINFRIARNLRNRLYNAVKRNKKGSAVRDLGCSVDELKKHLASQFQPGMSWDNYGEWQIDHIKPLSRFNLSDINQLREACHYTNLQPLWAEDNIRKSNKV